MYMKKIFRVAGTSPRVHIGNVQRNVEEILSVYDRYATEVDLFVTPELSLTGYTCADLFLNRNLLNAVDKGMERLLACTKKYGEKGAGLVVGLPVELDGELFNCAAFLHNGTIVAIVPKTYLPNYGEFYEKRWFTARQVEKTEITLAKCEHVPFGNQILISFGNQEEQIKIGLEVCEDGWAPISPGRVVALQGAELVVNISASNEVIGKAKYRRNLVSNTSASCICAYMYVSAGRSESTSDLVFSGHNLICENGKLLGELQPFEEGVLVKDIQLTKIRHDRMANKSFSDCKKNYTEKSFAVISCRKGWAEKEKLDRKSVV